MFAAEDTFYKDNEKYCVSVIDMLTPDVPVFTCGLNDFVKEYPTKKPITLTGAQIKMLMTCSIPETRTEVVDGIPVIRERSEYPRFAITLRGMGQMPTEKATILSRNTGAQYITPKSIERDIEDAASEDMETTLMEEPGPDRRADLEGATVEELQAHAKGLGLAVSNRATRGSLISAILKAEEAAAEAKLRGE